MTFLYVENGSKRKQILYGLRKTGPKRPGTEVVEKLPPFLPQATWWTRNWKWFLPLVILVGGLLFTGFVAGIFFFVSRMMRSSEPYQRAVVSAQHNPQVVKALGVPVEEGWLTTGNINYSGASGNANLSIPVHGPTNSGTIYVVVSRSAGEWTFSTLLVQVTSGERMVLTAPEMNEKQ